ncbi:MAG TPA: response regulator [Labilithrix sp.]|jgi:CheY-like chemotaxis protein
MEAPAPRRRVLLVEDNADALVIYGESLRFVGWQVFEAASIAEAEMLVADGAPDVVVLDCRLPDGDGLGLLERWRRPGSPMREVPVVVVTASSVRQDVEAALLAGADVFVPKPCPGNVLALHVERALTGKRASARLRRIL